jgi:hypothetical protein
MPRPTRTMKNVQHAVGDRIKELPMQAARLTVTGIGHLLLFGDRVRAEARQARDSGVGEALVRLRDDAGRFVGKVADRVSGGPPRVPRRPAAGQDAPATPVAKPPEPGPAPATSGAVQPEAAKSEVVKPEAAAPKAPPSPAPEAAEKTAPQAEKPATPKAKPAKPKAQPASDAAEKTVPRAPKPPAAETAKPPASKASKSKPAASTGPQAAGLPIPEYDERTIPSLRSRLRGLSAQQVSLLRDYELAHANRPEVIRMYDNRIAKLESESGG